MYAFFIYWKSGVPYSKARKDSATQAPEKQDRNAIHLETTRLTHSPETLMLSSGRRASSSSPSRKSVLLLNLAQVVQKLRGIQSFLLSRRMESLRDLISLVWLREVTMTRSILWWDFLMILVTPDIVHISFPFIWKIVKGKFQPWIVDGWLRTSLCLHLCSSWKLQLDPTKGLFFLQQRDLF